MTPVPPHSPSIRATLERTLKAIWFSHSAWARIASWLLIPFGWIVAYASTSRRKRIEALRPPHPPVIVVGNLVVGGSGKTPLAIALARELAARGLRPGLVCAGYRGQRTDARLIEAGANAAEHGDEAVLLAQAHAGPVAAGRDRAAALSKLLESHPDLDVVISDDGLQHLGLARTIEIAVFDQRGAGNDRLLPAGPLREPLRHLATMDAVALNDGASAPALAPRSFGFRLMPKRFVPLDRSRGEIAADHFADWAAGRKITAIAGIGAPERFFSTLASLGLSTENLALDDHAPIDAAWLERIPGDIVVMTSKDAVKCTGISDPGAQSRYWVLEVDARTDPAFIDWIFEALRGSSPA